MAVKRLFLAHYHGDAEEIVQLAKWLRLHGIVPWVDKDGGFAVADDVEPEARRAIREDCFGLLLYATVDVFTREFIRDVEIDEAKKVRQTNPGFALFAVPRRITFDHLRDLSTQHLALDLSRFHTIGMPDSADLDDTFTWVAQEILNRVVRREPRLDDSQLSLQYSTREVLPDQADDVLRIDARSVYQPDVDPCERSRLLLSGLSSVKEAITYAWGRPRLEVHGSKHLSAAFMFGRVFAPFEMSIRQTPRSVWHTDAESSQDVPLSIAVRERDTRHHRLFIELASGYKDISEGVDALITEGSMLPRVRLSIKPNGGPLTLDNRSCVAMAKQVYTEIETIVQHCHVSEVHLFAAVPQSLMMMLGQRFKGMPPVFVYDWDGCRYTCGCAVPGGVL